MILKYFKIVFSRFMKLSQKQQFALLNQILRRIGKREDEINQIINQIKKEINLPELNESLTKDFNLDFFASILTQFAQFQNMSEFAKKLDQLQIDESKISNNETLQNLIHNQDDPTLRFSLLLKTDMSNKSKRETYDLIQKLFTINKEQLSQEFDVNKRTLNKWLKHFFGQKYSGNRKIYLNDYLSIFKVFYMNQNENINENDFLEKIKKRIISGPSYFKNDIAQYLDSDLTTQKNNVEQLEFYKLFDKFPYSLAHRIANEMGEPLKF